MERKKMQATKRIDKYMWFFWKKQSKYIWIILITSFIDLLFLNLFFNSPTIVGPQFDIFQWIKLIAVLYSLSWLFLLYYLIPYPLIKGTIYNSNSK